MNAGDPHRDETPWDIGDDKLREECGVFGVISANDAAAICALGLHALQHRGQEAAGITSFDGHEFFSRRGARPGGGKFFGRRGDRRTARARRGRPRALFDHRRARGLRNVQPLLRRPRQRRLRDRA